MSTDPSEDPRRSEKATVERTDQLLWPAVETMARFEPEALGRHGYPGVDEEILQISPDLETEKIAAYEATLRNLERHRQTEQNHNITLDLEIMIESFEVTLEKLRFENERTVSALDPLTLIFEGLRPFLIDPAEPHQRRAALTRLQRYAGLEKGYQPLFHQAEKLIRARLVDPGRLAPAAALLPSDSAHGEQLLTAIGHLFDLHGLTGHEPALAALRRQHAEHCTFLRLELLPRARTDARLPPELFAIELRRHGVDLPIDELARRAHVAFRETQNEMKSLARLLAREHGWAFDDYPSAIRELRRERIDSHQLAAHYQRRLDQLADTAPDSSLPRLPPGALHARVASEAEQHVFPMPFLRLPRLLAPNTEPGQQSPLEIVVPTQAAGCRGGSETLEDYSFPAASWTLAAHEGWPGHGLQFAILREQNLSIARRCFGYTTAAIEGWALYAEAEIRPHLPIKAQLIALQQKLLRAARAWLGLALYEGLLDSEQVLWWLREQVGISAALAQVELRRVAFRQPVEVIAYLAGYLRLAELRAEAERACGSRFDPRCYHQMLLGQGLLPLASLHRLSPGAHAAG